MNYTPPTDWSPADNPYAIAVSEVQWWRAMVILTVERMKDTRTRIGFFSAQQIDARTLIHALRQLMTAVALERQALIDLSMDQDAIDALDQAEQRFLAALPGVKYMRDGLQHFDEWSRGMGKFGPQEKARRKGYAPRDVARDFWGFGFDPVAEVVNFGPYSISVPAAVPAALELSRAIFTAAHAIDARTTAEIRGETLKALTEAAIPCGQPKGPVMVPASGENRVWVFFHATVTQLEREELASKIVAALEGARLFLSSSTFPQAEDMIERLASGEQLYVQRA